MRRRRLVTAALVLAVAAGAVAAGAGPAGAASQARWAWCSAASEGTWQPGFGRWFVQNDAWNGGHGPQRICARTVTSWTAWSRQPRGNTAVETFPDSQKVFGQAAGLRPAPYSSFRRIVSSFAESMPHGRGISAEFGYDTWWGKGWDTTVEMMIWLDTVHRSMAGSAHIGRVRIYGQVFNVYRYAGSPPEYVFRLDHNEHHGTVHLLSAARWLVRHHYMARSTGLTAIPAGFEIASTGGVRRAFTLRRLTLTTRRS